MRLALIRHELNLMVKNKKNVLLLFFLILGTLVYTFVWLPNDHRSESLQYEEISRELEVIDAIQKTREERKATGYSPMAGRNYYADTNFYAKLYSAMIHAFDEGDFERYAFLRSHYLFGIKEDYFPMDYLLPDSPFPVKDLLHTIEKRLVTYEYLLTSNIPITYEVIEEKTSLQVFANLFSTYGPYLFLFLSIYISNDILTRDRKNTTTIEGLPVSWYQFINSKSIAAVFYTFLISFGFFGLSFFFIGITKGFGSFDLKIPVLGERIDNLHYEYSIMPIGKYLLIALLFLVLFQILFIRLNMIFSLLFKNEWIVLALSVFLLIMEKIYFARDKRELFNQDISLFPQTYIDFGKVITGEKNFLLNIDSIYYLKGLIILLLTWFIVEITLFLATKIKTKRRFYQ